MFKDKEYKSCWESTRTTLQWIIYLYFIRKYQHDYLEIGSDNLSMWTVSLEVEFYVLI